MISNLATSLRTPGDYAAFLGAATDDAYPSVEGAHSAFTALNPEKTFNMDLFKKGWALWTKAKKDKAKEQLGACVRIRVINSCHFSLYNRSVCLGFRG